MGKSKSSEDRHIEWHSRDHKYRHQQYRYFHVS